MRVLALVVLAIAAATAAPRQSQRIIGGEVTTINNYPEMVGLLYTWDFDGTWQECGGTILNSRSVLTAAHCTLGQVPHRWSIRAGSTYANSGGVVYRLSSIINHPNYNMETHDYDVGILRIATSIIFTDVIKQGSIAGSNYFLGDNQVVWAAGWGFYEGGTESEQLRHVQVWTVNQEVCRANYAAINETITDNMLCSGWLNVGGRDQCQGDSGGPLYHNRVVVGICSFGYGCAHPRFPGVNVRVSRFTTWIQNNA